MSRWGVRDEMLGGCWGVCTSCGVALVGSRVYWWVTRFGWGWGKGFCEKGAGRLGV